jgi:hypothetical protein
MIEKDPIKIMMKPSTGWGKLNMKRSGSFITSGSHTHSSHTHSIEPDSRQKLHDAAYCFYVYRDGSIEITKNVWEDVKGIIDIDQVIPIFSKFISDLKLKDTNLDMFKEGLSELLQESINNTLKGDYYEGTICSESARNGSNCDRSP